MPEQVEKFDLCILRTHETVIDGEAHISLNLVKSNTPLSKELWEEIATRIGERFQVLWEGGAPLSFGEKFAFEKGAIGLAQYHFPKLELELLPRASVLVPLMKLPE